MTKAIVGIIGGSGVYELPGLEDVREEWVATPWGEPSDALRFGRIGATEAVFLPRHGRGHELSPSGINYRANIDALKRAGVTDIVSVSACGSFKAELYPGLFVLDRSVRRPHIRAAKLVFRQWLRRPCLDGASGRACCCRRASRAAAAGRKHRLSSTGGTYVCMEGPQFSSLAESLAYKAAGCDVIGMTAMPEAKLAARGGDFLRDGRDGHRLSIAGIPSTTTSMSPRSSRSSDANAGSRGAAAGSAVA